MGRKLTVATCLLLAANICAAQEVASDAGAPATRHDAHLYFAEKEQAIWRTNADKLAAIGEDRANAVKALGVENSARLQAIMAENSAAHKALSQKGLSGEAHKSEYDRIQAETSQARAEQLAWYQESRARIDEDYASQRAAQIDETREQIALVNEKRAATLTRLLNSPVRPGMLSVPQTDEAQPGDDTAGVAKSGGTGEELYMEHCKLCHGEQPGMRYARFDLYEAVVVDDAEYFLNRVRNGPGPMPDIDDIDALTDGQVLSIRDFIRRAGDINTGVVVVDEPEKTPDPDTGSTPVGPVAGTSVPPGLPPVTPDSPLPGTGPGSTDAARDAQTQSIGTAGLTCNISGSVEVSWVAPLAWRAGWIPPGASMDESGEPWETSWMLRLRARLEDPTETNSNGHPAPGWCAFTDGSLGSAAGKAREIVIFAHSQGTTFDQFQFAAGDVKVWRSNSTPGSRGGRFALDVIRAVHGLYLPAGNYDAAGGGEVHGDVRRIDDRWSPNRDPSFLVIDN